MLNELYSQVSYSWNDHSNWRNCLCGAPVSNSTSSWLMLSSVWAGEHISPFYPTSSFCQTFPYIFWQYTILWSFPALITINHPHKAKQNSSIYVLAMLIHLLRKPLVDTILKKWIIASSSAQIAINHRFLYFIYIRDFSRDFSISRLTWVKSLFLKNKPLNCSLVSFIENGLFEKFVN